MMKREMARCGAISQELVRKTRRREFAASFKEMMTADKDTHWPTISDKELFTSSLWRIDHTASEDQQVAHDNCTFVKSN